VFLVDYYLEVFLEVFLVDYYLEVFLEVFPVDYYLVVVGINQGIFLVL